MIKLFKINELEWYDYKKYVTFSISTNKRYKIHKFEHGFMVYMDDIGVDNITYETSDEAKLGAQKHWENYVHQEFLVQVEVPVFNDWDEVEDALKYEVWGDDDAFEARNNALTGQFPNGILIK